MKTIFLKKKFEIKVYKNYFGCVGDEKMFLFLLSFRRSSLERKKEKKEGTREKETKVSELERVIERDKRERKREKKLKKNVFPLSKSNNRS